MVFIRYRQQLREIKKGGIKAFFAKVFRKILILFALPIVLVIRLVRPIFLFRFDCVYGYMGHFSADVELYLCARDLGIDVPKENHLDVFCVHLPVCNNQLLTMWKRILVFSPAWFVDSILRMNRLIPGGSVHEIATHAKRGDRDIYNWLDNSQPHLQFTAEEELQGERGLRAIGIPKRSQFVCLLVRDSFYHNEDYSTYNRHQFRDADIANYVLMAKNLAALGYYVIRMGAKMSIKFPVKNEKIIDYPFTGNRTEFLDIYLGAKCYFCVTTSSGWDAIPRYLFRKPTVFTNLPEFRLLHSSSSKYLILSKKHVDLKTKRLLSISELLERGITECDSTSDYVERGMELIENTPEEICEVTMEMVDRLTGTWKSEPEDDILQKRFWNLFPLDALDMETHNRLHGDDIQARIGAHFLRRNHASFLK